MYGRIYGSIWNIYEVYTKVCNSADDTTFFACDKDLGSLINRLEYDKFLEIEW